MHQIGRADSGNESGHDQGGNEISDEIADHLCCHAAPLERHSMLLDACGPNFPEQPHVPHRTENPVSCRCANNC